MNEPHGPLPCVLWRIRPDGTRTFYIYGPILLYELEESAAAGNPANTARYYHYDHLGNTIALTNDAGQPVARANYSAYGITIQSSGTLDTPFLWNGALGVQTDPIGLHHMGARYYHAYLGRFMSEDPLGLSAGPNVYAYCNGNPITRVDPVGLWASAWYDPLHRTINEEMLHSYLSKSDLRIVNSATVEIDRFQRASDSYLHAMRDPKDTLAEAVEKTNNFVHGNLESAIYLESVGEHDAAMQAFGWALNTIQDSSSPAHKGFQLWSDKESVRDIANHVGQEYTILQPRKSTVFDDTQLMWEIWEIISNKRTLPERFFDPQTGDRVRWWK